MTSLSRVFSRATSLVTRKTGDEYVLVPIANNIADMTSVYTLNETGAFIWEHFDGERNVEDIIIALTEEYDIDRETAEKDVLSFIDNMSNYLTIKK